MKLKRWNKAAAILALVLLAGCEKSKPTFLYMPDMEDSPAIKAQEMDTFAPQNRGMRMPAEGTIPRGYEPYHYKGDPEGAAANLKNPLPRTEKTLAMGAKTFNIYCSVCHGTRGGGDGSIIPSFPRPPSLHSDKVRGWTDGRIYHVIMEGQNNVMPSYASQIDPEERWAAIHYLRALQLAENPSEEDIKAYREYRKGRKF